MKTAVVWIDREIAKIFFLHNKKIERIAVKGAHVERSTQAEKDNSRNETKLYSEIISHLRQLDGILILGPGVARHHFRTFLNEHHPAVGRLVKACEASELPTDEQVINFAIKYLQKINLPSANSA